MDPVATIVILCFVFGAIVGSFLSVCAYRIPVGRYEPVYEGVIPVPVEPVSLLSPARSFCPKCQKQLLWWHNIPIVSWVILGGGCGFCKAKIPFRYPLIEAFTGAVCVLCYLRFGLTPTGVTAFAVLAAMIVVSFIDLDYMIIPNVISYPGTVLGLVLSAINEFLSPADDLLLHAPFAPTLLESVLGLLGGAGLLYSVLWLYLKIRKKDGLGLGDVKLLAMIGTLFGLECAWFTIFVGSMLGSVIGIGTALIKRKGLSNYIPFGPYLVAGLMAFVLDAAGIYHILVEHEVPIYWSIASR